ncbi:MAG: bifunctional phosphopantothenoylcysteine decarboxylase/phosphopantothenate--cysteine ligase CoaBC [Bauldia sp.]
MLTGKNVLLIIAGGIAAYKALNVIRRLREAGATVRVVLTRAGTAFVTPLSAGAIAGSKALVDLLDPESEHDVGHIRLAREADLIVVAPATADLLAKMAGGLADDLATAVLLAARCPILAAPAMNPAMWDHPATRRNVERLVSDGLYFVGPNDGEMAEAGEAGMGRMAEPSEIVDAATALLQAGRAGVEKPLAGHHVLVTSGPTHEPLDPVRYLANRSSGRQGHAIAAAAAAAGARVTLISGPVSLADPPGVTATHVETAAEMMSAVEAALPADVAILAAAVADWRPAATAARKMKKDGGRAPSLALSENPDILISLSRHHTLRPHLVIGFSAETDDLMSNAAAKLAAKGCDWIVANDVSPATGVFGGEDNTVHLLSADGVESWPRMKKTEVAARLITRVAEAMAAAFPGGRGSAKARRGRSRTGK